MTKTALLDVGPAVDRALREAGGGRGAGVRLGEESGASVYRVQFVRGDWLCTATVDRATGVVLGIVDEGGLIAGPEPRTPSGPGRVTRLAFRTVWDAQAAVDRPDRAYIATDAGVAVV